MEYGANAKDVQVSARVRFRDREQWIYGHVARKGARHAHIVCGGRREYRRPYAELQIVENESAAQLQTPADHARSMFEVDDAVVLDCAGGTLTGVITRLNPKRALVACSDGRIMHVPYALLRPDARVAKTRDMRSSSDMEAIASQARTLLGKHGLGGWSFQFDDASKRAGCCNHRLHLVSMSHQFARCASEDEILDTILHEIAHALVGGDHGHDAIWRAKALEIGCSGNRCHDVTFAPPRYIIRCMQGCWVTTAERRRRALVCSRCRGEVRYQAYSSERWLEDAAGESSHLIPTSPDASPCTRPTVAATGDFVVVCAPHPARKSAASNNTR